MAITVRRAECTRPYPVERAIRCANPLSALTRSLRLSVGPWFTQVFKEMYLDAVGEARDSPRRNAHQGMWHKHVFNQGTDREIEVQNTDSQPVAAVHFAQGSEELFRWFCGVSGARRKCQCHHVESNGLWSVSVHPRPQSRPAGCTFQMNLACLEVSLERG